MLEDPPAAGEPETPAARGDAGDAGDGLVYGTPRARWVLAAAVLGSGVASIDATVVGIALPPIGRTFHATLGALQWVVTGYTVTLAAFILLGGALGDRYGRRRIFTIGVVWFMVASVACGLAPTVGTLIAARAMQGVGGALLTPASLAIIEASFRSEDRSRAIGAWAALGGLATAAGPLVGGYLIAVGSWRWVFFINVPVVAAVLAVTARHVPESLDPSAPRRVDALGSGLTVVFLAALSYGLIEGPTSGWGSPGVVACLTAAGLSGGAWLWAERRLANPLLPLYLFARRQFSAANAVTFVVYGGLGGALFLLPVDLENVAHYSPLDAGLSLLPVTAIMLAFSSRSGRLAQRIGPRLQMSAGPVVAGGGLLLLMRAATPGSYFVQVLPAVVLFGAGLAITVAPLTSTALGAADPEHAGIASAVNNVVARAAGLMAVAVLPLLAGLTGAHALAPVHFAAGFRTALTLAGGACAAGGLLAALTIRNPSASARRSLPPTHLELPPRRRPPRRRGRRRDGGTRRRAGTAVTRTPTSDPDVVDHPELGRYEISTDRGLAGFVDYVPRGNRTALTHTEIDPALRGQGLAARLVKAALADLHRQGRGVVPICPYVAAYLLRHPEEAETAGQRERPEEP